MAEANSYEELRRRQVEGNKRKLDELRLHHLSAAVRDAAKPRRIKAQKPKARVPWDAGQDAPLRRSGRVASHPEQPDYSDANKNTKRREMELLARQYAADKERSAVTDKERVYAVTRAEKLADKLGSYCPTFVKPLLVCHVKTGHLAMSKQFCEKHLPKHDEKIVLVDEVNDEFEMFYNANKAKGNEEGIYWISAGWRAFAVENNLADGDCLVFRLIERTKFKVYIIRARK